QQQLSTQSGCQRGAPRLSQERSAVLTRSCMVHDGSSPEFEEPVASPQSLARQLFDCNHLSSLARSSPARLFSPPAASGVTSFDAWIIFIVSLRSVSTSFWNCFGMGVGWATFFFRTFRITSQSLSFSVTTLARLGNSLSGLSWQSPHMAVSLKSAGGL